MKLVIDIPEEDFERCKKRFRMRINIMGDAIVNGTPLPKGHGRLIDADELYLDIQTDEEMRLGEHLEWVKDRFDNAPTIIEADNIESEGKE